MAVKIIIISNGIFFKRLAVIKDGRLFDLCIERKGRSSLVDGIYVGRVTKVLPAINAAFINCGLEQPAFLNINDSGSKAVGKTENISVMDRVTEGAKLLVQVKSDEKVGKGVRVSRELSLVGRYFILNPFSGEVNVSRRLLAPTERQRLLEFAIQQRKGDEGFIVRTAAENQKCNALSKDISDLRERWNKIHNLYKCNATIGLIGAAPSVVHRFLMSQLTAKIDSIVVDDRDMFLEVKKYCERNIPEIVDRIEIDPSAQGTFRDSNLEEQYDEILLSEVPLPSGGRLYFDETRSMTTVDVDTGEASHGGNRFSQIVQTNVEAAIVLARQIRLRNVGGLVAIDFIGMRYAKDKVRVLTTLKKAVVNDPCLVKVSGFSEFGVVELTRQRKGFSHASLMKDLCVHCKGEGQQRCKSLIAEDIFSALVRKFSFSSGRNFSVSANIEAISFIRKNCSGTISDLEDTWAVTISFASDPNFGLEEFRVLGVE